MNFFDLVKLEFEKVKWFFFLPILFMFWSFMSTSNAMRYNYENTFYQYSGRIHNFSIGTFSLLTYLSILVAIVILAYVQYKDDSYLFYLALPINKKQILFPKFFVVIVFSLVSIIGMMIGYFVSISNNLYWITDYLLVLKEPEKYINTFYVYQIISFAVYFLNILLAYAVIVLMYTIVKNKIVATFFGIATNLFGLALLGISFYFFRTNEIVNYFTIFLPVGGIDTDIRNISINGIVSTFSGSSEIISDKMFELEQYQIFISENIIVFVAKIIIGIVIYIAIIKLYSNPYKLNESNLIMYNWARNIFVVCFAIYFSSLILLIGTILRIDESFTKIFFLIFLLLGFFVGKVIVNIISSSKKGAKI